MVKIIAEFCQNHNGSFEILSRMLDTASKNGATHGKIQNIYADNLTFRPQFEEGIIIDEKVLSIKRPYKTEYDRLKKLELSVKENEKFIELCKKNDLIPMTTCFAKGDIKTLKDLGYPSIKVASYDCPSYPMIEELANNFEELVISTGASFNDEIQTTAKLLNSKNKDFTFLHATTIYPTPLNLVNMNRMNFLKKFTSSVGYSDHTNAIETGVFATLLAIYCGASFIERHYTILDRNETRDGKVSITPDQLQFISDFSFKEKDEQLTIIKNLYPNFEIMLGDENTPLSSEELLNRDYYKGRFASIRKEFDDKRFMIYNNEKTLL
jgi:sialic acid synthase SpsE